MNAIESRGLTKSEWRAKLKSYLAKSLTSGLKNEWDRSIQTFVRDVLPPQGGIVASYLPKPDEPQVQENLSKHDPQWQWVYPRIEDAALKFYMPKTPEALRPGSYGILEPDPAQSKEISLSQCAVILVPGIGFDRRGTRLGRGLGFFDRSLKGFTGLKVGVTYSSQVVNEDLVRESHDVPMDVIVTEKFLLRVKG